MNKKQRTNLEISAQRLFGNAFTKRLAEYLYFIAKFLSHKFHLRSRYVLTKKNNLRLRYVAGVSTFMVAAIISFTLTSQNSEGLSNHHFASIAPASGFDIVTDSLINNDGLLNGVSHASIISNGGNKSLPLDREITIVSGDALGVVMEKQGIGSSDAAVIVKAMKEYYDPRLIKVGQKIDLHFDEMSGDEQRFREMTMELDPIKTLVVARAGDEFKARLHEKEVNKVIKAQQAEVKVSLYGSASQAGIPQTIVANAIRIFSWNVDFQRDIHPNDTLEVMYESYETESGNVSKTGDILYAKLKLGNREIPLYRFEMSDGRVDYFQPDGRSIKRTLMKTPINGARMSSGFGKRRHPVLGYTKMHKGVDFAASRGTPIFAAGDGVIEKAGWFSSYGKYIRIRHNSKLKTAYAHMSKIKPTIKPGRRVKQGQVIGYVGTTGRSTGPHLHYEVLSRGRQVNPRSVNLPTGEELSGKEMANFKATVNKMRLKYASTIEGTKVADRKRHRRGFFN